MKKKLNLAAAAAAALLAAGAAQAQWMPTGWSAGVGATQVSPNTSSGNLSAPSAPGTQVDIGSNLQPTLWLRGMYGNHFAIELPIGFGFKHDINGAGAIAGVGRIGTVKALPVTVLAEYHFMDPASRFRPYVAGGVVYAKMYEARGSATLSALNPANPPGGSTGLSVDSKWGAAAGFGATFGITDRFYADVSYLRVFLKTTAHLSTGQSIPIKLDPDAIRLGVGYRF
jgi:outer membrane protein